jgi:DNA-binding NarL/FixJ family response regulator
MHERSRRRALLGNLAPVERLGITDVLEDGGLEVVGQGGKPDAIVDEARRLQPDAVVLGLDDDGKSDLKERVRHVVPRAKVILWPRDETEMQVFDPGSSSPRRIAVSASQALLTELGVDRARERE